MYMAQYLPAEPIAQSIIATHIEIEPLGIELNRTGYGRSGISFLGIIRYTVVSLAPGMLSS